MTWTTYGEYLAELKKPWQGDPMIAKIRQQVNAETDAAAKPCIVYWLKNETCTSPWSHGYIGISQHVVGRVSSHRKNKRFPKNFQVEILFKGTIAECAALELKYRPHPGIGWNLSKGGLEGDRLKGTLHTPEGIKRMSKAALKLWSDPEYKKRRQREMVELCKDPVHKEHRRRGSREYWSDPKARERQANNRKGKKRSPESIELTRQARIGQTHTLETKNIIREKAVARFQDHGYRTRISEATKVAMAKPEIRAKVSAGLKGKKRKKHSAATKEKIRLAALKNCQDPILQAKRAAARAITFRDPAVRARLGASVAAARARNPWSTELRATVSKKLTGRKHTEASRAKMSAAGKGRPKSAKWKAAMSTKAKARYADPIERAKMSEAVKKGLEAKRG